MPRMCANVYHGAFNFGIVKRSLKYIFLTNCYDDIGSFHIFCTVLEFINICWYVCNSVSWRVIQQMCDTLGHLKEALK